MKSSLVVRGVLGVLGFALFAFVSLALPSSAEAQTTTVTPQSANGVQHFFDCFGAMLSNPALHQQDCGPGNAAPAGPPATMTNPGCTPVGMISFGDAVQVAALESDFGGSLVNRAPPTLLATPGGCGCPVVYHPRPGGPTVLSASLDSAGETPSTFGPSRELVGRICCFGEATPKSLLPSNEVAMIGSDLDPGMLPAGRAETRVANCCVGEVIGLPMLVPGTKVASLDPSIPAPAAPAAPTGQRLHLAC